MTVLFKATDKNTGVENNVKEEPDSGVQSMDIIDDISKMTPSRAPPRRTQSPDTTGYHLSNPKYAGIQFTRGRHTYNPRVDQATIQMAPKGPTIPVRGEVPFQYDDAAMNPVRKKDFQGCPMPLRDPEKEFESPSRFQDHRPGDQLPRTNSTFGMPIQHESHRFGLTTALWPIENRDSHLSRLQPKLSDKDPRQISRIYSDPRRADLAYKLENRRRWSTPFRISEERHTKLAKTSKSRKAVSRK